MKSRTFRAAVLAVAAALASSCASAPAKKVYPVLRYSPVVTMRVLSVAVGAADFHGKGPEGGSFAVLQVEAAYDGNYDEETIDLSKLRLAVRDDAGTREVAPAFHFDPTPLRGGLAPAGLVTIKLIRRYELAYDLAPGAVPVSVDAGAGAVPLDPAP